MADVLCARDEARYHIDSDLVPTLVTEGCGSENDWTKVYDVIAVCTAKNMPLGSQTLSAFGAYYYRNQARNACVATRTAAGQNTSINPTNAGQICTP